jgi:hypothetical protein
MRHLILGCVLAAAVFVAGCGSKAEDPPQAATAAETTAPPADTPTPTSTPTVKPYTGPRLTSPADLAVCAQLTQTIGAVSALVSHTTEDITSATNAKQLAAKMTTAQKSLKDSANVVAIIKAPISLSPSQRSVEDGLRQFSGDFGRAAASAKKGDINKASKQTVDVSALRKIQKGSKRIDDLCGN